MQADRNLACQWCSFNNFTSRLEFETKDNQSQSLDFVSPHHTQTHLRDFSITPTDWNF